MYRQHCGHQTDSLLPFEAPDSVTQDKKQFGTNNIRKRGFYFPGGLAAALASHGKHPPAHFPPRTSLLPPAQSVRGCAPGRNQAGYCIAEVNPQGPRYCSSKSTNRQEQPSLSGLRAIELQPAPYRLAGRDGCNSRIQRQRRRQRSCIECFCILATRSGTGPETLSSPFFGVRV